MAPRRVVLTRWIGVVALFVFLTPPQTAAQTAAPSPSPDADRQRLLALYGAEYVAVWDEYNPKLVQMINAESQRLRSTKGEEDPHFWDQVYGLQEEIDQKLVTVMRHAQAVDPPRALRLWVQWERDGLVHGQWDPNETLVAALEAAQPDWQEAYRWAYDTLASRCTATNAFVAAPGITRVAGSMEVTGGAAPSDWAAKARECTRQATLLLDFDSNLETTSFGDCLTSCSSHVHAEGVPLKYDAKTNKFRATAYPLQYDSFKYVSGTPLPCDTAYGVAGDMDVIATMTAKAGEPPEFVVQVYPQVTEVIERIEPKLRWGGDGKRRSRCADLNKKRSYTYRLGFTITNGQKPVRVKVPGTTALTSDPGEFGAFFTQTSTVKLTIPAR